MVVRGQGPGRKRCQPLKEKVMGRVLGVVGRTEGVEASVLGGGGSWERDAVIRCLGP